MKSRYKLLTSATIGLLININLVQADDFTGFTMNFVDIGNAGNAADDTGYGDVGYNYRIGTYEVSGMMIDAYNANSGGPAISMDARGVNQPATSISWNEAARFVNWLNRDAGFTEAYKFTTNGVNDNLAVWTSVDTGYDANNPYRNSDAHYYLPSENQWYKAAYYDPNISAYYNYATGSDGVPVGTSGGIMEGTIVYRDGIHLHPIGPADINNAGGLSPYNTMAQSGNVWEWTESATTPPNATAGEDRMLRGGSWTDNSDGNVLASVRNGTADPQMEWNRVGFRVAATPIPEPSGVGLILIGSIGLLLKRKRI